MFPPLLGSKNGTASITGDSEKEKIQIHQVVKISDQILENTVLPGNGIYLMSFLCNNCEVLPFDEFKVYKTTHYAGFNHLVENRDLNELHVHTLMESFVKDGYLFTILYVNEKMQIIDGQHRFEASKRKHLPVYFIVMPGWGIREVAILNVNSRNWKMEDFMNTHAKGGNQNYIRFKEFYEKAGFNVTIAELIIYGNRGGSRTLDAFRSGQLKVDEGQIARAYSKARKIDEFKDFHPLGYKSRNFVLAILSLLNIKGYDQGHMIHQLKKYPDTMLMHAKSLRAEEYQKILVEKYNFRKKDKIEL